MELRELECFVAVGNHLHFTRAAESLNLAQPYVSREVRRLERELGLQLLVRSTRQVELTDVGREYLKRVERVLEQLSEARRRAFAVRDGKAGRLVAAFAGSVTYSWLPFLAKEYRASYSDVDLEIRSEVLTGRQLELLLDGNIDIGLLRAPIRTDGIDTMLLDDEPLIAVLPSTHRLANAPNPIDISDLRTDHFVGYRGQGSNTHSAVISACHDAGFYPRFVQSVADTHSVISLVAADMGVALMPRSVEHFAVKGVTYRHLDSLPTRVPLLLAWRRGSNEPTVRNFVDMARAVRHRPI